MCFIISTKNKTEREMKMLIPMVVERSGNSERSYDIFSRLLNERIMFLNSEVRDENMGILCACALHLDHENNEKPIYLYLNSPGGSCSAGIMLADTLSVIKSPIITVNMGTAASMGAYLLSMKYSHKPGSKRLILPGARVMLHSISTGMQGTSHDLKVNWKESEKVQENVISTIAKNVGKTYEELSKATERDLWLNAEEALAFGIVDEIIDPIKGLK